MNNTTYSTDDVREVEREVNELAYVVASLLVALSGALIASFLGIRRRVNVSAPQTSVYGTRSRSDGLRKDEIRL